MDHALRYVLPSLLLLLPATVATRAALASSQESSLSVLEGQVDDATAVPALHAAALERHLFGDVSLEGDFVSFKDLVRDPHAATRQLVHVVNAALTVYDLPDLRAIVSGA